MKLSIAMSVKYILLVAGMDMARCFIFFLVNEMIGSGAMMLVICSISLEEWTCDRMIVCLSYRFEQRMIYE